MLIFLFFLLLALSIFSLRFFIRTNANQRRQIIVLSRQKEHLLRKIDTISEPAPMEVPHIKFVDIEVKTGTIAESTGLLLCPLESGPSIRNLEAGTKFYTAGSAYVEDILWYEICIDNQDNVDSKGWVKESSMIIDPSEDIL